MAQVIIQKLSTEEIEERGIQQWPIWEKEVSQFDWEYSGDEECLILEGEIIVKTDKESYNIGVGDFVTFKSGLKCIWEVIKPVKKYYNFP